MKLTYQLANVLGAVYHKGTLEFSPDGNSLLSPVGNKIVSYDLKGSRSKGVPIEVEYNWAYLCLSPNGSLLLAATEATQVYLCSMISGTVLHRKDFKTMGNKINGLQFSPNGKYYVILGGNKALIYLTPGMAFNGSGRELSPFKIHKVLKAHYDETCCVSWSSDSRLIAVGSRDLTVKVFPVEKHVLNMSYVINLSGHSDILVNCFFATAAETSLDLYTLSRNGQLYVWKSNLKGSDLEADAEPTEQLLGYTKLDRHYLDKHLKSGAASARLTSAAYHQKGRLIVTGFSNGAFLLHEMPDFSLIHSMELSTTGGIDSLAINSTGDWVAIGSSIGCGDQEELQGKTKASSQSQLVVWEWQSESFVLKQSGSGAGVSNVCECVAHSPDGSYLATGGTDGKIKLYNTFTSFCFVTFAEEHKGPVTALEFVAHKGGKVLLSASLDGTVRAFDLNRYRNFRTLGAPSESKPAQFICLAVDTLGGDFIAAGAHNFFEIFLWSLQTGRLLECLTGHEAPVSGVKFSPNTNTLVSCSWDGTARVWDLFEGSKCTREVVSLGSDALALGFRPDGNQFAVSTLNGNINFFDPHSGEQCGVGIEGRRDLGVAQLETELVHDKEKYFTAISYSSDGEYLIGGGKSKYICIYNVKEKMLMKKFTVTWNLSMDGMYDYISRRKVAEFGFNLAMIKARDEKTDYASIALPGVARGDFSSRAVNPVIATTALQFSPTMRSFAAATTEGILVYSLDVGNTFDPYQLDLGINQESVKSALKARKFGEALMQSLKLNEFEVIKEAIESVPKKEISFVSSSLPLVYVEKCLHHIAVTVETTRHLEFYLLWCHLLFQEHGSLLKNSFSSSSPLMSTLRLLQRNLSKHLHDLGKLCDFNKYLLNFIVIMGTGKTNRKMLAEKEGEDEDEDEDENEEPWVQMECTS